MDNNWQSGGMRGSGSSGAVRQPSSASATSSPFVHKYKLVFLGDQAGTTPLQQALICVVGKTSLITRFMYDSFDTNYQATIGIDFLSKTLYLEDRTIRLQLWDTAGQERFRTLIPSYIRDAAVTVIVYDVTQRSSFESVDQWIADVKEERGESMEEVIVVLVGNKADASEEERQVSAEEGEEKARMLGVKIYMETSAKSGQNVKGLFMRIAGALPVIEPPTDSASKGASQLIDVRLSGEPNSQSQQRCAC